MENECIKLPEYEKFQGHILRKSEEDNKNTAWYEHGFLVNVSPRNESISLDEDRDVAYHARFIILDGKKYDLYNPLDIISIAIPDEEARSNGNDYVGIHIGIQMPYVTRELAYHLQMRVKTTFSRELAIPLAYKAVNLMLASKIAYGYDMYERQIEQLYAVDALKYADHLKMELLRVVPGFDDKDYGHKQHFQAAISRANLMGYDLLEIPYSPCTCEVCAKYMGRYYSISGNDKRFPSLPKEWLERSQIHEGCHCSFFPSLYSDGKKMDKWVFDENDEPKQEQVDIIESSNRPFVDDRSEAAKIRYERSVEKRQTEELLAEKRKMSPEEWAKWGRRNVEYEWIQENLPNICPKSLSGYTKGKNAKSKKYIELKEAALALGKILEDDDDEKMVSTNEEPGEDKQSICECAMPINDSPEHPENEEMKEYCQRLHESYNGALSAFRKVYPAADRDLMSQIDRYSRESALYMWLKFGIPMEKCIPAVNAIYLDDIGKADYTEIDIDRERPYRDDDAMPIPFFFYGIIKYDKENGTDYSSRLVACFQTLDIIYALIDGVFEKREAEIVKRRQFEVLKICRFNRIPIYKNKIDVDQYITTVNPSVSSDSVSQKEEEKSEVSCENEPVIDRETGSVSGKRSPMKLLNELIGLQNVKKEIKEISDFAKVQIARKQEGLPAMNISYHLVFTGNPGTGKTTVARLVAQIYKNLGVLNKGQLIEVSAKDMIAGYVGQTAIKTGEVIEKAIGGVLFIDEAYSLLGEGSAQFGQEAVDTLLKEMEDNRDNLAVIVAGYDDEMLKFINSNPGLKSRFNRFIHFDDYTPDELFQIFESFCKNGGYEVDEKAQKGIRSYFEELGTSSDTGFANGRSVRNVFEGVISKQASRIASKRGKTKELLSTIEIEDVVNTIGETGKKEESLEDVIEEFNSLTGLERVKEEVSELVYVVQNRQRRIARGLKVPALSLHLVFTGNPGTGKTTVARSIAKIYKCLGLLSKGQLVETDRSGLVAGYVGQTAIKTKEVIDSAIGGILFIDEAYTLSNGGANDFGQEAIDTLLKAMEDNRDDLVVIVAGYDDEIRAFINSNPGLASRFNRYIHFGDYSSEQMTEIFKGLCIRNEYTLSQEAEEAIRRYFDEIKVADVGNGRGARNLFEKVTVQQAKRTVIDEDADLQAITVDDIAKAINRG